MNKKQADIARLKARNYEWPVPWPAVEILAGNESFSNVAYLCPANVWTIAWGETVGVKPGMTITDEAGDLMLLKEVGSYAAAVLAMCKAQPTANQLGALVCLAYNIGLGGPKSRKGLFASSVLKAHNAGDAAAAARAFNLYNKARVNGVLVELPGLVKRRAAESALYLTPDEGAPETPLPQAVEPETPVITSPINVSGATMVGGGLVTMVTQYSDAIAPVMTSVSSVASSLQINPLVVLGVLCVGAGLISMYWRFKQRHGGWS